MNNVIRFRTRRRAIQPITAEQVAIRDATIVAMGMPNCPDCGGSGRTIRLINARGFFPADYESIPCPCGGDDETRVDLDEPDFDGAA